MVITKEFYFQKDYYFTFQKLNISTFWGPSLNGFAKFVKINQLPLLST